jgi:hypothetical protein
MGSEYTRRNDLYLKCVCRLTGKTLAVVPRMTETTQFLNVLIKVPPVIFFNFRVI